jgi:hypothetical protein
MNISSAANETFKKFILIPIICQFFTIFTNRQKPQFFSIYYTKFRVYLLIVTFNHENWEFQRRKYCITDREKVFLISSLVDEYHLPQMNSEKVFLGIRVGLIYREFSVLCQQVYSIAFFYKGNCGVFRTGAKFVQATFD